MENKFLRCSGSCSTWFHLACLQVSDTEYAFYMSNGESTNKRGACVKEQRTVRNEDTPTRTLRFASTSDLEKKVISPGRDLILPEIANVESISVQLETIRLISVCTNNLIESLIQVVSRLLEEVGLLRKDNEILKMKAGKLAAAERSGSSLPDLQSLAQRDVGSVGSSSSTTSERAETRMLHTSRNPAGATQRLLLQQLVTFPHQPRNLQKGVYCRVSQERPRPQSGHHCKRFAP
jgi:hypothetical protein